MPSMTKSPHTSVRVPEPIREAFATWQTAHPGVTLSEAMLIALCHHIGQPELVDSIRQRGRPAKADPVRPAKKAPRKRK